MLEHLLGATIYISNTNNVHIMQILHLFDVSTKLYKSLTALGNLRNSTDPVLSFIDWIVGFDDFIALKHKPRPEEMAHGMIYFYKYHDDIYYITKKMPYNAPAKLDKEKLDKTKNTKGRSLYKRMSEKIDGKIDNLSILSQNDIYKLLIDRNEFSKGLKYYFHIAVMVRYKRLEQRFILSYPHLHKTFIKTKIKVNKLFQFITSETGCRILGISTVVVLATLTGGTVLIVGAAAYTAGVIYSTTRQTINKIGLNRLKEEAELLEKYALTYTQKISKSGDKNIQLIRQEYKKKLKEVKKPSHAIVQWLGTVKNYVSTYIFELGIPITLASLSPITAIAQFSLMISAATISSVVGVVLKKDEDEKKQHLRNAIIRAKEHVFIPNYSSLSELREHVNSQDHQLSALTNVTPNLNSKDAAKEYKQNLSNPITTLPKHSWLKEYGSAFYEVINPYDQSKTIKDSREVSVAIDHLKVTLAVDDLINEPSTKPKAKSSLFDSIQEFNQSTERCALPKRMIDFNDEVFHECSHTKAMMAAKTDRNH